MLISLLREDINDILHLIDKFKELENLPPRWNVIYHFLSHNHTLYLVQPIDISLWCIWLTLQGHDTLKSTSWSWCIVPLSTGLKRKSCPFLYLYSLHLTIALFQMPWCSPSLRHTQESSPLQCSSQRIQKSGIHVSSKFQ